MQVRLDQFDPRQGFSRGRPKGVEVAWYACKCLFFLTAIPWPSRFKAAVLRAFGAEVGRGVVIKPRVNIHFPWKVAIGDHCWIGEEAILLSFEEIRIEDHVCISQRAFLCAGNHDYRDPTMRYRNAPITVSRGAWVGASSFVAPGVTIGAQVMVAAGSVVVTDLPPDMVCSGNPCAPRKPRQNPPSHDE